VKSVQETVCQCLSEINMGDSRYTVKYSLSDKDGNLHNPGCVYCRNHGFERFFKDELARADADQVPIREIAIDQSFIFSRALGGECMAVQKPLTFKALVIDMNHCDEKLAKTGPKPERRTA